MKNIFLLLLFISTTVLSQNFEKNWNKVIDFENLGKIKSANNEVEKIYKKAKNFKDEVQIIKCFFFNQSIYKNLMKMLKVRF